MGRRWTRRAAVGLAPVLLAVLASSCGRGDDPVMDASGAPTTTAPPVVSTTVPAPPSTTVAPTPPPPPPPPPPPTTTTTVDPILRIGAAQAWLPYALAGDVQLLHPSSLVERIGFHESAHDGAQVQVPLPTAVRPVLLESHRERDTPAATAADVVVAPGTAIRAPVSGVVKRGGSYTLYCDTPDEYVVIEPDAHPGWEVKILHMTGVVVHKGDRVTAGQTDIAQRAHALPFESQVDEDRPADPAWPHVHVEVVDPSIPDRPTPGAGCD